tara:strand:- start:1672 stop:2301 length:630 start_codon:yes stop_codon:yes gene_type:complete
MLLEQIYKHYINPEYKFIISILLILDNIIELISDTEIIKYESVFRNKLAYDLIEKNIYKKFNYSLKLRKNDIFYNLQNNIINYYVKQYISIYLNINILILIEDRYYFINDYNNKYCSIILLQTNNGYIPIKHIFNNNNIQLIINNLLIDELYKYKDENTLEEQDKSLLKYLKTCKLTKLRDFGKKYNISSYMNMKKTELYESIKYKIMS